MVTPAQDLELLKAQRGAKASALSSIPPSTKRYLILTYAAQFDRVHYPLPLLHDDTPDPARLRGIIKELRGEVRAGLV